MSFIKPQVSPELASLTPHTDANDVVKALGIGNVTTDNALMIQGQAFTAESLDDAIAEITVREDQMKVFNSINKSQAGNIIEQWNEVYSIGFVPGMTVSDIDGGAKEGTRSGRRRYLRLKFFTSKWGVNENVTAQANFQQEFNKEDVAALTRMYQDQTWMVYEASSDFGGNTGEPKAGNEYDGLYATITDPEYYSEFDGPLVYDCLTQGSGLDARGLSNPKDLEAGLDHLSSRMIQAANGQSLTRHMWMGTSVRGIFNEYQNFEPVQILSGEQQRLTKGSVVAALANPYDPDNQPCAIHTDSFLPDIKLGKASWMVPAGARGVAQLTPQPTVVGAVATAADSFFKVGWDGTYFYGVVPFGKAISRFGYEGETSLTTGQAVAQGGKVTLTITAAAGGLEDGYLIYRSRRGGTNNPADMRLIKRIPRTGNSTTFTDLNRELPGASKVYLVDFADANSVEMKYLYNPIRTPLPRSADAGRILPAFVAWSLALKAKYHRRLAVITNFQADRSWNPQQAA